MKIILKREIIDATALVVALSKKSKDYRSWLAGINCLTDGTVWASNGHVALVMRKCVEVLEDCNIQIDKQPDSAKGYVVAVVDTEASTIDYAPEFESWQSASADEIQDNKIATGTARRIDCYIPKMDKMVVPRAEWKPVTQMIYDADYLALIPKIAAAFGKLDKVGKYTFQFTGDNLAGLVKIHASQLIPTTLILMPLASWTKDPAVVA